LQGILQAQGALFSRLKQADFAEGLAVHNPARKLKKAHGKYLADYRRTCCSPDGSNRAKLFNL